MTWLSAAANMQSACNQHAISMQSACRPAQVMCAGTVTRVNVWCGV